MKKKYKEKAFHQLLRSLMKKEREKRINYIDRIRSCYNRQIILSYCTSVGKNIKVGPKNLTLKIRGNVAFELNENVDIKTPIHITLTSYFCEFAELYIGKGTHIGPDSAIRVAKSVKIGNNCLIARWVRIIDHNGHALDPKLRLLRRKIPEDEIRPVTIGNNVWIGEDSFINAGVNIGSGSIISANSVVTKDIPKNVIAFGSPARPIFWFDKKKTNMES